MHQRACSAAAVKILLVVLSAAVVAGLGVYAAFDVCGLLRLGGESVYMHVDTFVALMACLSATAAALSLLLRMLLVRADRAALQDLERRIAQLEAAPRS